MSKRQWLSAREFQKSKMVRPRKDPPEISPVRTIIKNGQVLERHTLARILSAAEVHAAAEQDPNRKRSAESHVTALRASLRLKNLAQRSNAPPHPPQDLPWEDAVNNAPSHADARTADSAKPSSAASNP